MNRRNPSSGYREFDESFLRRLPFIKSALALGFTLEEIDDLLSLHVDPTTGCSEVRGCAIDKISEVDVKIRELQRIKGALSRIVSQCTGAGPIGECPIVEALGA